MRKMLPISREHQLLPAGKFRIRRPLCLCIARAGSMAVLVPKLLFSLFIECPLHLGKMPFHQLKEVWSFDPKELRASTSG